MKKVLFIDRDGTIINEPKDNFQVDSLEKLGFLPKVIRNLYKIATELEYELVMVTNQDGLGTTSFPEDDFWQAHLKMLSTLKNEGIEFKEILIDRSFEHENAPTRKPRIGMLKEYLVNPDYDLTNSFVIGDRFTDMQLAYNLGTKGILIGDPQTVPILDGQIEEVIELITNDWDDIYKYLSLDGKMEIQQTRSVQVHRKTNETDVLVKLKLDGIGKSQIQTGIGFFDHMLEQLAKHAQIDLSIQCAGDLHIDQHHSIEDTAIVLGQAFGKVTGNKKGMERYGFSILPMDEALAQVAIDFSGRPYLVWQAEFRREMIGNMPTEMFEHFFKSFSDQARCTLNIKAEGVNEHHKIEIIFKAFARAVKMAIKVDPTNKDLPSTKGVL